MSAAFMVMANFSAVTSEVCAQTISESQIEYVIDMGGFAIHHGMRYGSPIVIAEHNNQQADQLSGIWYDDGSAS